jgi:hypothetical protein
VPRNAAVSVGSLWGWSGDRTCGISVGTPEVFDRSRGFIIHRPETPASGAGRGAPSEDAFNDDYPTEGDPRPRILGGFAPLSRCSAPLGDAGQGLRPVELMLE